LAMSPLEKRDAMAGVCMRCYKLPAATAANKRCQKCQIATLTRSDSVNEGPAGVTLTVRGGVIFRPVLSP
jgi:ribosomal protein L40E